MRVIIIAEVREGCEKDFRQALDDEDFSWMMEMSPKWLWVKEIR